MDESTEELELEPLFDYSRVQPISFVSIDDDDLYDSGKPLVLSPKRLKKSETPPVGNVVTPIVSVDNDEEDWLLPPPKAANVTRKVDVENSTLKALRLKKQELASVAQSVQEVVRDVEESVRKEFTESSSSSSPSDKKVPPLDDRAKVVISIQDKEGQKQFRVFTDEKFEKLFKMYAEKVNRDLGSLVFSFDGDKISGEASPAALGMEDDDIIEVRSKSG